MPFIHTRTNQTISQEAEKKLAKDRKFRAIQDENYANTGYETDLSKEKLYADVSERYKL